MSHISIPGSNNEIEKALDKKVDSHGTFDCSHDLKLNNTTHAAAVKWSKSGACNNEPNNSPIQNKDSDASRLRLCVELPRPMVVSSLTFQRTFSYFDHGGV